MSKFLVAYSKLLSLKDNLPNERDIEEYYVQQFHNAIQSIKEVIGEENVNEFEVEASEVKAISTGGNYDTGETFYSADKYCDREKVLTKIDALLNYLRLQAPPEEKEKIGFRISQ